MEEELDPGYTDTSYTFRFGSGVGVGVAVGLGDGVGVAVGLGVGVAVGSGVGVAVGSGVGIAVGSAVGTTASVGVIDGATDVSCGFPQAANIVNDIRIPIVSIFVDFFICLPLKSSNIPIFYARISFKSMFQ